MNLYSKYMEIAPSFLYGLLCFSAILVWTLVAILTLPLWLLFRVFKWSQGVIISYYKLGRILASNDVPFLHETEINRNYINGLFVMEGEIGLDDLRKLIISRVVQNSDEPSYARMRKRVVKQYWRYVWVDEQDFDIKKHVFKYDGIAPRSEDELQQVLSEQFSSAMCDDISPWEIIVTPMDMPGKDQTAICMRIHHTIGDAFALIGLFCRLMDKKPELLRVKKPVTTPCDKQKQVSLKNRVHLAPGTLVSIPARLYETCQWRIQGPGVRAPPLLLDQTEDRRAEKTFWGDLPSPYLRVWMTAPLLISRSGSGTACNHQSTAVRDGEAGTMCNTNATSAKSLNGDCNLQPVLISLCTNSPSPQETLEKPLLRFFPEVGSVHKLSQCGRLKTGKINIAKLGRKCNADHCSALSGIKLLLPWLLPKPFNRCFVR